MADRKTDKQHAQETQKKGERQAQLESRPYLGEPGAPAQGGRGGGELPRDIGSKDERKRAFERPASVTRVRKSHERSSGESD